MSTAPAVQSNADSAAAPAIRVRGCRVHNLRNIDIDIPRDQMVVITGPSGSGKSSLAYDTLFAEGQRQYIESLGTYARQFLAQLERPDAESIDGLQPTISIDQRAGTANPRSTVATVTEIYDYLRLLFARVGDAYCYQCNRPISQQHPEQILEALLRLPEGTRLMLLAPLVRGRKGEHAEVFESIRKLGFVRARVNGQVYELDAVPALVRQKKHTIEAVVDRLIVREGIRPRLAESLHSTLHHGEGLAIAMHQPAGSAPEAWSDIVFSTEYACPECGISYEELEPRTFSFNSPYGACPACSGLGHRRAFDDELLAPDASLTLADGAIVPWRVAKAKNGNGRSFTCRASRLKPLTALAEAGNFTLDVPLESLKPKARGILWNGTDTVPGVLSLLEAEYATAKTDADRDALEPFRDDIPCAECHGARLRPEARSVRVGDRTIQQVTSLPVDQSSQFFSALQLTGDKQLIAAAPLREINSRLRFLHHVGLDYLTLDRAADTLSGGELQRVRLATGLGSALVGICYILDEPSIGLHPRDNQRLIAALRDLQQQGNTVLVVEHDEAVMRACDWLVDMGPGAGKHGGTVVAEGPPDAVSANDASITGRYLAGTTQIDLPAERRPVNPKRVLTLEGATCHNLKSVDVSVPLGVLTCVTGVSGSGKSSLFEETLARALARKLNGTGPRPGAHTGLRGVNLIDRFVQIDQTPIGRTPRSTPATYIGVFDEIRKVFAQTREARLRGFTASRFSFNVAEGRCSECQGQGQQRLEMNFLPDLYVECPACRGKRFNRQTLEIKYKDKSIADVLDLDIDEGIVFFENFPVIARMLACLADVGLGYLSLGQSCITLSGGEAQRIKLCAELGRSATGNTLYLLDEPTTGLHFDDVRRLLEVMQRLVTAGNTMIVIEHNLDVIKSADWIIDMGPEGGAGGGQILFAGMPEALAAEPSNNTGKFLAPLLQRP
ncbi:MAG: excinuclease ABC subunit UvrA [Planctomycetes bacterium]|nr:excinuclease ABC subunit UvrA [Planctomycetota bacterium]